MVTPLLTCARKRAESEVLVGHGAVSHSRGDGTSISEMRSRSIAVELAEDEIPG